MLGCHSELCRRDFLIFTTFLFFSNFLLLPVRSSSIGVKAMRGDLRDSGNRSEHWGSKTSFIKEDKNILTSEEDSKLEKVKTVTKKVLNENLINNWWRERPPKEDLGFVWERDEDKSKRKARKKKKRIVKSHNHKFAILHNDL